MSDTDEDVQWEPPIPGHWRRDFRLAEWLPGPVTRSCETWLLPTLDRGLSEASLAEFGSGTKEGHVVVNGWCFTIDPMPTKPMGLLTKSPIRMMRIGSAMARMGTRPEMVEAHIAQPGLDHYVSIDLPALQALIVEAEGTVATAEPTTLVATVDALALATGHLMPGMVQSMGFAGKVEYALATFHNRYLAGRVTARPLDLTVGISIPMSTAPHAVTSLDWSEPTAGERGVSVAPTRLVHERLVEHRTTAEIECRAALSANPRVLARFDLLVSLLARWVPVRERMAAEFTLAWPSMRSALTRIGHSLVDSGAVVAAADTFHLSREEIVAGLAGSADYRGLVDERRSLLQRQRSLTPPLTLGKPVRQWRQAEKVARLLRTPDARSSAAIVTGIGSSPGTVTGVARVVLGLEDFEAFQPGEVLVAPATAPAWTPLLAIAAGVVTDGGGAFAHTSVVAREFGIPAIVSAADATRRIRTGSVITLDAAAGTVMA